MLRSAWNRLRHPIRFSQRSAAKHPQTAPYLRSHFCSLCIFFQPVFCTCYRSRRISHLYARWKHPGCSNLLSRSPSPVFEDFFQVLADRNLSCPKNMAIFQKKLEKNRNFYKKALFKKEKIGYNKKTVTKSNF